MIEPENVTASVEIDVELNSFEAKQLLRSYFPTKSVRAMDRIIRGYGTKTARGSWKFSRAALREYLFDNGFHVE